MIFSTCRKQENGARCTTLWITLRAIAANASWQRRSPRMLVAVDQR